MDFYTVPHLANVTNSHTKCGINYHYSHYHLAVVYKR